MDGENHSLNHANRFIFSDNYYSQLGVEKESNSENDNRIITPDLETSHKEIGEKIEPEYSEDKSLTSKSEVETEAQTERKLEEMKIDGNINKQESPQKEESLDSKENNKQVINELLKPHSEMMKPEIVTNTLWEESPQRNIYRARRNPIRKITPIWEKAELMPDSQMEDNIQTPNIIYIEENLKEEHEITDFSNTTSQEKAELSNLLETLLEKEQKTGKISMLARYGDDFCSKDYITNPAIGRDEEIKELILILLTPEKSGILVGKPGIGKTSIVEGLAYKIQRNQVPIALQGYRIVSMKTTSLLGNLPNGETKLQTLIDELKGLDKIILFIDEIHMLMGATNESGLDFANMFKESLGRGNIKMIGATTNDEYERYVLRDKAFVRRFQRVDVEEPTKEETVTILMGTLPKIEKKTGAKLLYTNYIQKEIMSFIVEITTEYKRVYGIGSRYPDICLTLLTQAFSEATFENRKEVTIKDIRKAIETSKNIYPDVIQKELINFDLKFKDLMHN